MGTWGYGIVEDDVAMDTRDAYEDALADGLGMAAATDRVLEEWADALGDIDDGPVIYLALAAVQLEYGSAHPRIREQALTVIHSGLGLAARKAVLEELRARLVASSPGCG